MKVSHDETTTPFTEGVAYAATELARAAPDSHRSQVPVAVAIWAAAEVSLSASNLKEANDPLFGPAEVARREHIRDQLYTTLRELLDYRTEEVGLKVEFGGDPRGPAIRVLFDGAETNSLAGGLIIPCDGQEPSPTVFTAHAAAASGDTGDAATDHEERIKFVCAQCGSEDVIVTANAGWDQVAQDFIVHDTFDDTFCRECEEEVTSAIVPVSWQAGDPLP